jgi:GNAT superfamily N-acetyltransferase
VIADDVQIRLATADDAESIAEILFEAFSEFESGYTPEAFAVVTPPPEEVARRFEEGPMWVALKDEEIVGTVSVLPEPEWLYIRSMAVLPTAQGHGIGYRLLDVIEEYGIKNGFDRLFLYTTYFSPGAIRLYEKNGFVRGRDTTADEWYGTPGLAMDKKLDRNIKQNVVGS